MMAAWPPGAMEFQCLRHLSYKDISNVSSHQLSDRGSTLTAEYLRAEVMRGFSLGSFFKVSQGAVECSRSEAKQLGSYSLVRKCGPMLLSAKLGVGIEDMRKDRHSGCASGLPSYRSQDLSTSQSKSHHSAKQHHTVDIQDSRVSSSSTVRSP
jgi:hypothetical protein